MPPVAGVRLASIAAGVRYTGRADVMLAVMDPGTAMAGGFTRSATRAAPVLDCEAKIGQTGAEGAAILVNAGNANSGPLRLAKAPVSGQIRWASNPCRPRPRLWASRRGS